MKRSTWRFTRNTPDEATIGEIANERTDRPSRGIGGPSEHLLGGRCGRAAVAAVRNESPKLESVSRTNLRQRAILAGLLLRQRACSVLSACVVSTAFLPVVLVCSASDAAAAVIPVTTLRDEVGGGHCSLKEAIYAANTDSNIIPTASGDIVTACIPGSGDDIIVLPTGKATLPLSQISQSAVESGPSVNPYGPTATPFITSTITIEGNLATLVWTEDGPYSPKARLFAVGSYTSGTAVAIGNLTIRNLYIKGFVARAGDGGSGAGGGLGAGGAVFVREAQLTVENCTFDGNWAIGGNGGGGSEGKGGGGGMGGGGGWVLPRLHAVGGPQGGGGGGGAIGNGGEAVSGNLTHYSDPSYGWANYVGGGAGGGGGTLQDGGEGLDNGGAGGIHCGGKGGDGGFFSFQDGGHASCPGGGGGGGGDNSLYKPGDSRGGDGDIGGGGGGSPEVPGLGGFGGGGGAGGDLGGYGGFGGGGGGCHSGLLGCDAGFGGEFGGDGCTSYRCGSPSGGGGAGLGGAIFNYRGTVVIRDSTFSGNYAVGGRANGGHTGAGHGGAIFAYHGSTTIINVTIANNQSTGWGEGVYIAQRNYEHFPAAFYLHNTIIAGNGIGDGQLRQCTMDISTITGAFSGNLIQGNDPDNPCDNPQYPGTVSTADPQLGPLQVNERGIPTMAIPQTSPAFNNADPEASLPIDQRGQPRPAMGGYDIGAFELCLDQFGMPCLIIADSTDRPKIPMTIEAAPAGYGTTTPAPGTYNFISHTVVNLTATPNPGYYFINWSGDVTDPSNPTTTVITQPQTVTANFGQYVLTGLGSAELWIGEPIGNNVPMDLVADVLVNGILAGTGQVSNAHPVPGSGNSFQTGTEFGHVYSIPLALNAPVSAPASLEIRLSARLSCSVGDTANSGTADLYIGGYQDTGTGFYVTLSGAPPATRKYFPQYPDPTLSTTPQSFVWPWPHIAVPLSTISGPCPSRPYTLWGSWSTIIQ